MSTIRQLAREVRADTELRREAFSMSLYVSIVLLSALTVFDDDHPPGSGDVFLLELGTTVGLVLAHGFASWVSALSIGPASGTVHSWDLLRVQLGGAVTVASVAMFAVLVAPSSMELPAARFTVAAAIAVQVFLETRPGRSVARAALYGFLALAAGVTVAAVKSWLVH